MAEGKSALVTVLIFLKPMKTTMTPLNRKEKET